MNRMNVFTSPLLLASTAMLFTLFVFGQKVPEYRATEGDFLAHDFKFGSGEKLAELRLHLV